MPGTLTSQQEAKTHSARQVVAGRPGHRGLFLTVDGPGGVGKSTLVSALAEALSACGHRVHRTMEPSGRPVGVFARSMADKVQGRALACLFAADRYDHLTYEIEPHLAAGYTVLCDRYLASTLVVQHLDGVSTDYLLNLNDGVMLPDIAVILTAEAEVIRQRLARRGVRNRFQENTENTDREIALYRQAARQLASMGVKVLILDTGSLTPSDAALHIAGSTPSAESGHTVGSERPRRSRVPAIPLLTHAEREAMPARARGVIEYDAG
jgi:dTMP kinase